MAENYKRMTGDEFVKKVLAGERNFSRIELREGTCLSGLAGFEEMQRYLQGQDLKVQRVNLSGSNLALITASGLFLPYANLEGADLREADLKGANLYEANLEKAGLGKATLNGANLNGAYLVGANLNGTNLNGAYLVRADLNGTNLYGANLNGAYLVGANLNGAYLVRANLNGADLNGADLVGANLGWADLRVADLREVLNLEQAIGLEHALFGLTKVTPVERKIIEKALKLRPLFEEVAGRQ